MKISKKGDKIILTWKTEDPDDTNEARIFFTKLTREGWFAARRNSKLQRTLEFKPEHKELWFIPLSEGG